MVAALNGSGCKKKQLTGGGSSSGGMVAALNGSGCKKKINRRLAAAVAASAMRHRRSWKEKNQPEVAAAVVAWLHC